MLNTHKVLSKLFVKRFYKENAGLFFFLFILFLSSLLYINFLDKVPPTKRLYWNLIMTIKLMTNPYLSIFIAALFVFYIYKIVQFLIRQFAQEENGFMFNCLGAYSYGNLFIKISGLFFLLLLPLYSYVIFSFIVGQLFNFWKLPFLYFVGTIFIHTILSVFFTRYFQKGSAEKIQNTNWLKFPLLKKRRLLTLEYVLRKGKLMLLIAKLISVAFIFYGVQGKAGLDTRLISLGALFVVLAHSFLLFQTYRYHEERLSFLNGFPSTFLFRYLDIVRNFGLLLLPEIILVFYKFNMIDGIVFSVLTPSFILLYWNLLDQIGAYVKRYFKIIFVICAIEYVLILFGLQWLVALINMGIAYYISYKHYHCEEVNFF